MTNDINIQLQLLLGLSGVRLALISHLQSYERRVKQRATLREKCPSTKFFLVLIFPHSDWIRRDTSYLPVFSRNTGKHGPKKTPYLDTFHVVLLFPIILGTQWIQGGNLRKSFFAYAVADLWGFPNFKIFLRKLGLLD